MNGGGIGPAAGFPAVFWSWVFDRLVSEVEPLLNLRMPNRPSGSQAVSVGADLAASVLFCPFAFVARDDKGSFAIETTGYDRGAAAGVPDWVVARGAPTIARMGFLYGIVIAGAGRTLEPDKPDDGLAGLGVTSAVAALLRLRDNRSRVLVVCNRPAAYPTSRAAGIVYPDAKGQPAQLFGTPDLQLLQCIAWMIERAY